MARIQAPIALEVPRGPVEHERRVQIVEAARLHFRASGYDKTSVAALAEAIGVSSAYVYRFFDSKRSIGEAVCAATLETIARQLLAIQDRKGSAAAKLRAFFDTVLHSGHALFIRERKMHELVAQAVADDWQSVQNHRALMREVLRQIVQQGRADGEFDRQAPLDSVVLAIAMALIPYAHPMLLEQRSLEDLEQGAAATLSMVLRSLAP